jgi:hypothetical protein
LQILVDALILEDAQQTFVDLTVEDFVFVCKLQVVFSEVLSFDGGLIQLSLTDSH